MHTFWQNALNGYNFVYGAQWGVRPAFWFIVLLLLFLVIILILLGLYRKRATKEEFFVELPLEKQLKKKEGKKK
jgi:hypothetical protein